MNDFGHIDETSEKNIYWVNSEQWLGINSTTSIEKQELLDLHGQVIMSTNEPSLWNKELSLKGSYVLRVTTQTSVATFQVIVE